MPKLVKVDSVEDDHAVHIPLDAKPNTIEDLPAHAIVPLATYLSLANTSSEQRDDIGVWISSDDDIDRLLPYLNAIPVIACHFSNFMDGRSFSQSRLLREKHDYQGEIRATGNYIQDQMCFLLRCGFDAFSVGDEADIVSMQASLSDFSESYQAACDNSQPLFRRRA